MIRAELIFNQSLEKANKTSYKFHDQSTNLESAALRIVFGKQLNCGHICKGVDRLVVSETIYDKFEEILLEQIRQAWKSLPVRVLDD